MPEVHADSRQSSYIATDQTISGHVSSDSASTHTGIRLFQASVIIILIITPLKFNAYLICKNILLTVIQILMTSLPLSPF